MLAGQVLARARVVFLTERRYALTREHRSPASGQFVWLLDEVWFSVGVGRTWLWLGHSGSNAHTHTPNDCLVNATPRACLSKMRTTPTLSCCSPKVHVCRYIGICRGDEYHSRRTLYAAPHTRSYSAAMHCCNKPRLILSCCLSGLLHVYARGLSWSRKKCAERIRSVRSRGCRKCHLLFAKLLT